MPPKLEKAATFYHIMMCIPIQYNGIVTATAAAATLAAVVSVVMVLVE